MADGTGEQAPEGNEPTSPDDWSPADHPYAIAVSEAQWWRDAARLAILRMQDDDDPRLGWLSSRQIDARQLVFALRQLLAAEELEQFALKALGMDTAVGAALTQARIRFENALPDVKHMRDGLMHFEDWSRGEGRSGPQKEARRAGMSPRDIARDFWSFGYDPNAGTVSFGLYVIRTSVVDQVASDLSHAIYLAAHEVDKRTTARIRIKVVDALAAAEIRCDDTEAMLHVTPGNDLRIWLSLRTEIVTNEREDLANQVVAALSSVGIRLVAPTQSEVDDSAVRLARGESLYVVESS